MTDALNGGGIGDQFETPGSGDAAEQNVGEKHRLAGVQGESREDRRAGENQEDREYDDVALHDMISGARERARAVSE